MTDGSLGVQGNPELQETNPALKRSEVHTRVIQHLGSQAFKPSTREVETGGLWLGGERIIRWEETEAQVILRFQRDSTEFENSLIQDRPFDLK